MAAPRTQYTCSACGATFARWVGKCTSCGEFNTVTDTGPAPGKASGSVGLKTDMRPAAVARPARRIGDINTEAHKHTPTGIGEFDRVLGGGLVAGQVALLSGEPGAGKALALDTELATPSGWITMGEVRVGDVLFGLDGRTTRVVATSEVMTDRDVFELTFSDGTRVVADADHQWYTRSRRDRLTGSRPVVRTTREIFHTQRYADNRANHSVPTAEPLWGQRDNLPVPPYTLGAWLGDGSSAAANITSFDEEILENIRDERVVVTARSTPGKFALKARPMPKPKVLARTCPACEEMFEAAIDRQIFCSKRCGSSLSSMERKTNRPPLRCLECGTPIAGFAGASGFCRSCARHSTMQGALRSIGVLNDKHIPMEYLRASEPQRRALLAGLLDTDGFASKFGAVVLSLTNKRLADDAYELMTSLGYKVSRSSKPVNGRGAASSTAYNLSFTPSGSPFRLGRKSDRVTAGLRPTRSERYIVSVRPVPSVPVKCVQVDNEDHTYLITRSFIPTHNSTLLLDVANRYAAAGKTVLYVSGEESAEQITLRARRMNVESTNLYLADETDLSVILGHIEQTDPDLVIIDSIQTIASPNIDSRAGGVAQVNEVSVTLTRVAKARHTPMLVVAQITKDGNISGPMALSHVVDTVLFFEGDRNTSLRLLRTMKNRFGAADEVACFEQTETGLAEVPDPSGLFRTGRDEPVAGTCITVTVEGRRAMLAEVQALVAPTNAPNPRRGVSGLDTARMAMLVAVTERHGRLRLFDKDTFLATVAGMKISEPAADLAVCLALASAANDTPVPSDVAAIGEVSLSGDIRPVSNLAQRLSEASRLGFRRVLVPQGTTKPSGVDLVLIEVGHLTRALAALSAMNTTRDAA